MDLKIQLEEFSMSMSISAVGSGGGGGFDPAKMASRIASKMMSDLDPNSTGKVTTDQFISGMACTTPLTRRKLEALARQRSKLLSIVAT
jgi:hypothetical protein